MSPGMLIFVFLAGIPIFMYFEHPIAFWLVIVPLYLIVGIKFILWLKKF